MDERTRLIGTTAVDEAVAAGKLLPQSRQKYLDLYASNPSGTLKVLAKLYPCLTPGESGSAGSAPADDSYPKEWIRATEPPPVVTFEDASTAAAAHANATPGGVRIEND